MLPEKEQINILKRLSTLLAAGVPAVKAMEFSDFPFEAVSAVMQGKALSESAEPYFSNNALSFIKIGEAGGDLATAAAAAYQSMASSREQKSAFVKALAYPMFTFLFGFACIFFFAWYIVPQLKTVFLSMNIEPSPALAFIETFAALSAVFLAVFALLFAAAKLFRKNKSFERLLEDIKTRSPFYGSLFKKSIAARALSDISCLLKAGLPLAQAIGSVSACTENVLFKEAFVRIKESVEQGKKLSQAFAEEKLLDPFVSRMALVGEESGDLASALSSAAQLTGQEMQDNVKLFAQAAEPAATIAVGVFAGLLVFSMLSPITSIMDKLQ
ncbi:MAG: type II secretion system F family protein [Candidatus Margulisiibacteriota bacterium]